MVWIFIFNNEFKQIFSIYIRDLNMDISVEKPKKKTT